jgi:uncharacterized protein
MIILLLAMKIILAGGSGHLGGILVRHFLARGAELVVLSRAKAAPQPPSAARLVNWDGKHMGDWAAELDDAAAVINLAGRSVDCRYSARNRLEIMNSRVQSTLAIGAAIERANHPPPVWLQSSTATIYAHRFDAPNDELTGILGGKETGAPEKWNFSIQVAKAWEQACEAAVTPRTRKVIMRIAMVMSTEADAVFDTLLKLVKRGLGGQAGSGRQFMSWIHAVDFVRSIDWLMARDDLSGPVNVCAPNPIPNEQFMRELREATGIRFGLSAPAPLLELGTLFMRTESELILKSRRVVPTRLQNSGFSFEYPTWPGAVRNLLAE